MTFFGLSRICRRGRCPLPLWHDAAVCLAFSRAAAVGNVFMKCECVLFQTDVYAHGMHCWIVCSYRIYDDDIVEPGTLGSTAINRCVALSEFDVSDAHITNHSTAAVAAAAASASSEHLPPDQQSVVYTLVCLAVVQAVKFGTGQRVVVIVVVVVVAHPSSFHLFIDLFSGHCQRFTVVRSVGFLA